MMTKSDSSRTRRVLKAVKAAGGERDPGARRTGIDRLIDDLYFVLPATTREEIAAKLSKRQRREPDNLVLVTDVNEALVTLRRNPTKYGWTVPHVKRGTSTAEDAGRYFAVLVKDDGSLLYHDDKQRPHLLRGFISTVSATLTQHRNEALAFSIVADKLPAPAARRARSISRSLMQLSQEQKLLIEDLSGLETVAA